MLAVKSMDVRENFKSLCDKVFRGETLIVSRPKNENIVMMSESEYNEIIHLSTDLMQKNIKRIVLSQANRSSIVTTDCSSCEYEFSTTP